MKIFFWPRERRRRQSRNRALELDEALTGKKKKAGEEDTDAGKELIRGISGQ